MRASTRSRPPSTGPVVSSGGDGERSDGTRTTRGAIAAPAERCPAWSAIRMRCTNRPAFGASVSVSAPNGTGAGSASSHSGSS